MKIIYESFEEFKKMFFQTSSLKQPKNIAIGDVEYTLNDNHQITINEMVNSKPYVAVYQPVSGNSIGIAWMFEHNQIKPHAVDFLPDVPPNKVLNEVNQNVIGNTVELEFPLFSSVGSIRGKVDTGATFCSLHCTKWNVQNNKISFMSPDLSNNVITMDLRDNVPVKSADGGVEYRPVIELDVSINGVLLKRVLFNLNDRSDMEFPILVGQNALESGKFLINPSKQDESIDWTAIENFFRSKE